MAGIATIGVKCPRCDSDIKCTLESGEPVQNGDVMEVPVRVTDLADRFSEHYATAHGLTADGD